MQGNMKILSREFSLLSRRMKDAVMEMKNVRSLAGASMLSALGVVIHAATTVIASLTQMISFAFLTVGVSGPVSYTHLDVYKRQVLRRCVTLRLKTIC